MDAAASEWKTEQKGIYRMPKSGKEFTTAPVKLYHYTVDLLKVGGVFSSYTLGDDVFNVCYGF